MTRSETINAISELIGAKSYLEIGVEAGTTFREVSIYEKHAVDPDFKTDVETLGGHYYKTTSDAFFKTALAAGAKYDIIFIDGLHTFEQSLKDLLNSHRCLSKGGVIVIDDVAPSDYIAALRDHKRARELKEKLGYIDRNWMGDVFKTIAFLHDYLHYFDYATTDSQHSVSVIVESWPNTRDTAFGTIKDLSEFDFLAIVDNDNLLNKQPWSVIETMIRGAQGSDAPDAALLASGVD